MSSPLDSRYTFDKFIVGPSNNFVAAAAERISDSTDVTFNPLVIYGGVGLGKTHLMHAIAWKIRKKILAVKLFTYLRKNLCINLLEH